MNRATYRSQRGKEGEVGNYNRPDTLTLLVLKDATLYTVT